MHKKSAKLTWTRMSGAVYNPRRQASVIARRERTIATMALFSAGFALIL